MYYKKCPHCGAHLDPGEQCDCHQEKREDAPDAAGTPSVENGSITDTRVAHRVPDVNDCMRLREIRMNTGAMAKDAALVVRDVFPKFNRQLLAQCEAWGKYGIIIHPEALAVICAAYGVSLPDIPAEMVITAPRPRKQDNRKLARKLTFRMKDEDYTLMEQRVRESGCQSSQEWLYEVVLRALQEGS